MHRISDTRIGGIAKRNFSLFRKLCGDDSPKNVVIVTTMWGKEDTQIAEARERQLRTDPRFFQPVFVKGASMVRHQNTVETAHAILDMIITNQPLPLCIQQELVDRELELGQTSAGLDLSNELAAQAERHRKELEELREEMKEALEKKDVEARMELEEAKANLENKIWRLEIDGKEMSLQYAAEKHRWGTVLSETKKKVGETEGSCRKLEEELRQIQRDPDWEALQAQRRAMEVLRSRCVVQ